MTVENRTGPDSNAEFRKSPLRPPGHGPGANPVSARTGRTLLWAFAAALLLLLGVLFVLPQWVSPPPAAVGEKTAESLQPADDSSRVPLARKHAELRLQEVLRLQAALQRVNAPAWAQAEWAQAGALLSDGDRAFGERRFAAADKHYQQALALLQSVQESRTQRLQQALDAARAALEANQVEEAISGFEQALRIEAEHEQASSGLARAKVRPQVLDTMLAADEAQAAGDLAAAINAVQSAIALDADYQPAQTALVELEQRATTDAFNASINAALRALDEGRLDAAGTALDDAAQHAPQHASLIDARQRLAAARQGAALTRIRKQAGQLTSAEKWEEAVRVYRRALKVDANAGFARQGLLLAEKRAALHQQFDHYLDDPARLYSAEPLANAERLLAAIVDVPAAEPKLGEKRRRLARAVDEARKPLTVILRSDGQTEIVVYHVGRLGSFTDQRLQLKPGTYTAVGSRPGFRDVRQVFTLRPGQDTQVIELRCEETL